MSQCEWQSAYKQLCSDIWHCNRRQMHTPACSDAGIVTVSGQQFNKHMHPIGLQLQSLQRVKPLLIPMHRF